MENVLSFYQSRIKSSLRNCVDSNLEGRSSCDAMYSIASGRDKGNKLEIIGYNEK